MGPFTTIITHPDNVAVLRNTLMEVDSQGFMFGPTIRADAHLDRDKPSGKYTLPDGRVVERESVRLSSRFIDYGPEDIDQLVYLGYVKEHRELLFYELDESKLNFRAAMDFGMRTPQRHAMIVTTV